MQTAGYKTENLLRKNGALLVAGIDEVGRGALAGPLVAGVVILPKHSRLKLCDSKLISAHRREELDYLVKEKAVGYGLGWVTNTEIDTFGLAWSLREAYLRALEEMNLEVSQVILDGSMNYLADFDMCQTRVKADRDVACVAAASILAKVARDEYMHRLCDQYPQYCYETNVGYGTKVHTEAIRKHGLTDLHRKSFCSNFI